MDDALLWFVFICFLVALAVMIITGNSCYLHVC